MTTEHISFTTKLSDYNREYSKAIANFSVDKTNVVEVWSWSKVYFAGTTAYITVVLKMRGENNNASL